jgi:hypothetical protein
MKQTNGNLDLCYHLKELMTDSLGIKWSIPCNDRKVATVSYAAKGHMLFAMVGEHPDRPGVYHRGWLCLRCVWDGEFYIPTGQESLRRSVRSLCCIRFREPLSRRTCPEPAPQHLRAGRLEPLELSCSIEGLEQPRVTSNLDLDAMLSDARFWGSAWYHGFGALHVDRGTTPARPRSNCS